jgi:hypothetical protein
MNLYYIYIYAEQIAIIRNEHLILKKQANKKKHVYIIFNYYS